MKTTIATFLLLALTLVSFAQTKDETAIRKVIEAEDVSFYTNKDRMAHVGYWHITPYTRWWYSGLKSVEFLTGDQWKADMANNKFPPADNAICSFSDFVIKANDKLAWVTYEKKTVTPEGKTEFTHEFRGMEKISGVWKIISASVHEYQPK